MRGSLLRGFRSALQASGRALLAAGNRIPTPVLSPIRLSVEDRALLVRNSVFRDCARGRRCFVIGNGPSLGDQDLTLLKGEITFVANGFWQHPVLSDWQPTYYCFVDPVFFDGSPVMEEFFRSLRTRVTQSTFFAPLHVFKPLPTRRLIEERGWLPAEHTHFVALDDSLADRPVADFDPTVFVPAVLNVAQFAIMLAIYMGCSPIYLLGLDHDWLAHQGVDRHFYANSMLEKHPGLKLDSRMYSYRWMLEVFLKVWRGYENLAELAQRKGAKVLNATRGGYLDVFERVDYESVVSQAQVAAQRSPR